MLVLSRRPHEKILIGSNIVVTVLQIDGERVKLGIEAPSTVTILRQELCEEVRQENVKAAQAPTNLRQILTLFGKRATGPR